MLSVLHKTNLDTVPASRGLKNLKVDEAAEFKESKQKQTKKWM